MSSVPPGLTTDSSRASLLDAIRGFQKTKLQSVDERKVAKKKKRHDDAVDGAGGRGGATGGGDLMSDLAAQLKLRRKGISGAGKPTGNSTADSGGDSDSGRRNRNPLDRLAKLIPPPPAPKPKDPGDSRDEDWMDS